MSNNIDVLRDKLFSRMTGAEDPAVRPEDTVLHCYNMFIVQNVDNVPDYSGSKYGEY